jgi:adhesin HecA-like repeat protein
VASRDLAVTVSDTLVNSGGLKGQRQTVVADTLDNRRQGARGQRAEGHQPGADNRAAGALSSDGSTVTARERLDNQGGRVVGVTEPQVNGGEVNKAPGADRQ